MKINKDLVDATMMLSFISLVLIGTTDFENMLVKEIMMGAVGFLALGMVVLRVVALRKESKTVPAEYEYE